MRVILAEDSILLRQGMAAMLESDGYEIVAQVGDAQSLLARVAADPPDVVVTDVRMPPTQTTEGLEAAISIKRDHPQVGVLVLSAFVDPHYALQLMNESDTGIGYLLKDRVVDGSELINGVRRVGIGESVVDGEVVAQLLGRRRDKDPLERLTDREREVLSLMAEGLTNRAISERLTLNTKTTETHVRNIFAKLGLLPDEADHRRVLAVLTFLRA
jgi:DNA-binding NarL/FixJ family response regulator